MNLILTNRVAIEFSYDEGSKHSCFGVVFVEFDTRKRVTKKFPLWVSSVDLCAAVAEGLVALRPSTPLTHEQLLWHCSVYENNIYYLRTLLHDTKLHSFVVWLLAWYVQSFVLSLAALLANEGGDVVRGLPEQVPEVLWTVMQASMLGAGRDVR